MHFQEIFQAVTSSANKTQLIYITTKPEPSTKGLHPKYQEFDVGVKKHVAELPLSEAGHEAGNPPVLIVDAWAGLKARSNHPSFYGRDGLHLSRKGYNLLNQWVKAAMQQQTHQP